MSQLTVKAFNILVHYGENSEKNFVDLLDEALLESLLAEEYIKLTQYMYAQNVKKMKIGEKFYLQGVFFRSTTLRWTQTDNGGRGKKNPGSVKSVPRAMFIIDIENHRLYWITDGIDTSQPTAYHFCTYIKRVSLPKLQELYENEAKALTKKQSIGKKSKRNIYTVLNLTTKTFSVKLNPEVSKDKVEKILGAKNIKIHKATFYPRLNNSSDKHFKQLFTDLGDFGAKTKGDPSLTIDPKDPKSGLEKEPVFGLLQANETEQILSFEFKLKDLNNPHKPIFTVANTTQSGTEKIQKTETLESTIESKSLLKDIIELMKDLKDRAITQTERKALRTKIAKIVK